ncbi:malonyl-ACP O-methyltransferase BioC [Martelella alba]|uniref:Malonyl-[acyl-carrier protein] O-methyltransferase n=1 Tax=Martelella alba TaxID=2590451 RepID=A0ABY2SN97_9HYPH|nr:malonyl-ACP O-methyltransferase BioC [Martelella alba]TKI07404.1 malonyl-ACP O-methyltransferase BioC [Martelella alba]
MSVDRHKRDIAKTFGRAAADYDRHAVFQRASGRRLAAWLGPLHNKTLLDAGCGTGWFSRYFRRRDNRVIALDLSTDMLGQARRRDSADFYLAGDIERMPLGTHQADACFSNLALQWCDDLPRALSELYRVTRPGGLIAFSTLAEGSLGELAHAWRQVDDGEHINRFLSPRTIAQSLRPYRYRLQSVRHRLYYSRLLPLLQDIKGVGAGYLHAGRSAGLGGSQRLRRLDAAWERQPDGLPLTYDVIYGLIYRDEKLLHYRY